MTGLRPTFRPTADVTDTDAPIESRDQLLAFFEAGCKGPDELWLGVESESLPLLASGAAAPFSRQHAGEDGASVEAFLSHLARTHDLEHVELDGHLLGLIDGRTSVHLEPGAQPELALPPVTSATEVLEHLRGWRERFREASQATGVHPVPLGLQPVTPIDELLWTPKDRYRIMREHLGARGRLAHHMMKGSAGVQFNVDYRSEADAAAMVRTALAVSPLVNAACANSPLEAGERNGCLTKRPLIWMNTDPERCGLLPWIFEEGFTFERYVQWALSAPAMFVVRDGWERVDDLPFDAFIDDGHPRIGPATHADFHLHLTTLFPEVRVKQHVEIRGADACAPEMAAAVAALWRGVLYDLEARDDAAALLPDLSPTQRETLNLAAGERALDAEIPGRGSAREALQDLLAIARSGLGRLGAEDDAALMEPLREIAATGRTAAHAVLAAWEAGGPAALVEPR